MQNLQAVDADFHQKRRLGIGGSDAAPALGLSKFKTPFGLYEEKLGLSEPEDENWNMARGKQMEPLLRQHFSNTTGLDVRLPLDVLVSEKYPFMRYNPDGLCDGNVLAEFKTAGWGKEWGDVGTDEIPHEYILQVQHGLIVTGYEVAKVSASIGGMEPKYYEVPANRELQEMIIEGEHAFWEKVMSRTPPEPINNEDVCRMYSRVNGAGIIISPEIATSLLALRDLRARMKADDTKKEELEVIIKNYMGENEFLTDEVGNPLVTWKQARGAERIDSKLLKENAPDVYERYIKIGDPTRRFLLK